MSEKERSLKQNKKRWRKMTLEQERKLLRMKVGMKILACYLLMPIILPVYLLHKLLRKLFDHL